MTGLALVLAAIMLGIAALSGLAVIIGAWVLFIRIVVEDRRQRRR